MGFEVYRRTEAEGDPCGDNGQSDLLAAGARQLLSEGEPEAIIQPLCERLLVHLDCQVFAAFVNEPDSPRLRLAAHAGMPEEALQAIGCPFPGMAPRDCRHRPGCQRAAICGSGGAEDPLVRAGIRAYACHPLVYQGRNIGILAFGTRTRACFSEKELDLMRTLADLVAAAVAHARDKEALGASEERLRLALAGAGAGCYEWNLGTGQSHWSEEIWALYGLAPRSVPASYETWRQTVHPEDLARAEAVIGAAVARGAEFEAEWRVNLPAGAAAPRWLMSRAQPVRGKDGSLVRYIGIAIDISRRKQMEQALRENQARLQMALEGASAGVWEWQVATGELSWSPQQYDLWGLAPGSLPLAKEGGWESAVYPDDLPAVKARLRELLAGQASKFREEWRVIHPQRGTRWILALGHISRAEDRTPLRLYGINIDITEHKEWEEELERRVAERTAELVAANQELEGFTYAASHDMKGPLGRINSFSTLLARNYRERLEGDGLVFLDLIQQNAVRLNSLVEDLLDHTHIGQRPLPLQAVEARAAVTAVLQASAEDIRQRGADIRIDFPDSISVRGNPLALSLAVRKLVDNALKYTDQATPPVIEIGGRRQEDRCRLWVRDNGIGLDMVYRDRIFELFRRLHTYSEYPGNGIGLATARKAMERMDGRVWVESQAGQGATFFLELPLSSGEDEAAG